MCALWWKLLADCANDSAGIELYINGVLSEIGAHGNVHTGC